MTTPNWYMLNKDGMATLCTDKEDAEKEAADAQSVWPHMGPHRAVQLVDAADVEALRAGYAAARLEIESLRARSVAPDPRPVVEMCAKALAEELAAWDIDPPLHHVKEAHDACESWLAAIDAARAMRAAQPEVNLSCKSTQKRLATQWGFVPAGAQQPGADAWTPLPGAMPEAGKPVLLDIGKKHPIRAMWVAKHTAETASDDLEFGEYDEATDTYYCPEGWYEQNEHEDVHWRVDKTPVAWCELPPKVDASYGQAPAQAAPQQEAQEAVDG